VLNGGSLCLEHFRLLDVEECGVFSWMGLSCGSGIVAAFVKYKKPVFVVAFLTLCQLVFTLSVPEYEMDEVRLYAVCLKTQLLL